MNDEKISELKRLKFEDYVWVAFIVLSILDIVADNYQKKFIITDNLSYEQTANKLYTLVVFISVFIYLYFFVRNYKANSKVDIYDQDKYLFEIKLLGSIFFLVGVLCLLYFQVNISDNTSGSSGAFIGGPAL